MSAGSVLVVCGQAEAAGSMQSMLSSEGFYPVHCAQSGSEARRQFLQTHWDLMIVSTPLPDEYGPDLVLDADERTGAGIVVIARPEHVPDMQCRLEQSGTLILPKPINRLLLLQTARFALSVRNSLLQLKNERDDLQKRMDERKLLEQAKWLLVDKLSLSEPEAFRLIQKKAMDLRLPQVSVAERIIKKYHQM